jgi:3-oxoacyl-[acyl-carrier protein] reductase
MNLGIGGRKAIVNGGSAGMGRASALALAREGVDLVVSARGEERLMRACREIAEETGARVTPVAADHSTPDGMAHILDACPDPDILVGTCSPPRVDGELSEVTRQQWLDTLGISLLGPIDFMQAVLGGMAERGWGRIVNIATVAAKFPTEPRVISGAPRAALANYTVGIAKKAARRGVVINNVLPGMVRTDSALERYAAIGAAEGTSADEEIAKAARKLRIPTGGFGDPDQVGALVAFLCSAHAGYLVGQNIVVDGGLTTAIF